MSGGTRREFIKVSVAGAIGLCLGLPSRSFGQPLASVAVLHPLINIGSDGKVIIYAQNPEMGQGVKTSLPMIIGEELDVDWSRIVVMQSDFNAEFDNQFSGGSLSIRLNYDDMRRIGATARQMLVLAAADRLGAGIEQLRTEAGQVHYDEANLSLSYGELAEAAATQAVPDNPPLRDESDFRIIGTPIRDVDLEDIVLGRQQYGQDVVLPHMLVAAVKRCPVSDGQPESFDDEETRSVAGVVDVVMLRNDQYGGRIILPNSPNFVSGVAVLAEHTWAAMEGARRLKVNWKLPAQLDDSETLMAEFDKALEQPGEIIRDDGDLQEEIRIADRSIDVTYRLPFLAHVPMEPMNCTVHVEDDQITVWAPTQNPSSIVDALVELLGVAPDAIAVKVMRSGGAFGRRFYADFAVDAAILSAHAKRPVKVVWTREDDIRHDYFRPACAQNVKAAANSDGQIIAWHQKLASHSRMPFLARDGSAAEIDNYEFPAGFVPNLRFEYVHVPSRIPVGQWRAVEHSANVFVVASVLDELAHAVNVDPVAMLLRLIGDEQYVQVLEDFRFDASRLRNVVQKAAEAANWGQPVAQGRGKGIAVSYNQGSWVAEVAEVSVVEQRLTVHRIVAVLDCGRVINPSAARSQVEGGIIEGISATLMGKITVSDGVVTQSNFNDYPICRLAQVAEIDVRFVDSTEPPRGLGEPPLPPVAPAICNAIFAATGRRIRELPLNTMFSV